MNKDISNLQLYTLSVGLAEHNADWNWKNVRSPFARLYYVVNGKAIIETAYGSMPLRPRHLYFIPPYMTHNYVCDSIFTHYYIHIHEQSFDGMILEEIERPIEVKVSETEKWLCQRLCDINPHMKLAHSNPVTYDNQTTYMQNLQHNLERSYPDKVESRGILYLLMSHIIRCVKPREMSSDTRVKSIINYIKTHIYEEITIEQLAKEACLSKDHFIRCFRQAMHETPMVYVTKRKIERAEMLLASTDMTVKAIALGLSFSDTAYFIRVFRKITGVSPTQYRNHVKNEMKTNK
jgi:AraC-like DNA-binding protein